MDSGQNSVKPWKKNNCTAPQNIPQISKGRNFS